jgi:hypothetical protein
LGVEGEGGEIGCYGVYEGEKSAGTPIGKEQECKDRQRVDVEMGGGREATWKRGNRPSE